MPSAVAFLPPNINVFVNLETSLSLNLGSGMIRRLGTSRRRGMRVLADSYGSRGSSKGLSNSRSAGLRAGTAPPDGVCGGRLRSHHSRLGAFDAVLRALAVS